MKFVVENGRHYAIRNGQRIEVIFEPDLPEKPRRKPFKPKFVQVPVRWIAVLERSKTIGAYRLAHAILAEAFKRKHLGGAVILSSVTTGMPQTSRRRATRELQKLGLIQIERQSERKAPIVQVIY
jgi:hypothetical protein